MSNIILKTPESPYLSTIDTGVMEVTITEAYLGTTFITKDGEMLHVCMRDSGFELAYGQDLQATPIFVEAKNGEVKV